MRDMFFTLEKLQRRTEELKTRRYFGHRSIAPFTAMDGQLSVDDVYRECPEVIEGEQIALGDFFVGRDRYMWFDKETELLYLFAVSFLFRLCVFLFCIYCR